MALIARATAAEVNAASVDGIASLRTRAKIRTMRGEGAGSRRPGSLGRLGWVICLTLRRASGTEHYHPQSGRFRARSQSPSSVAYRLRKLATPIALAPR